MLANNGGNPAPIIAAFDSSLEATVRFGDQTPAARVTAIYQHLFNRAPDAAGLAYWTGLVSSGQLSMAEAAFAILNGAQGADNELATLRLQVASDFTFWVGLGASGYGGDAALIAARVLLRAITPGVSSSDQSRALDAAVKLSDLATSNPQVIALINAGHDLLALFDTPRGGSDPVRLMELLTALAGMAVQAPASLDALLRGGDIAGLLAAMPATLNLQQLLDLVRSGSVSDVLDAVYPPEPVVVVPPPRVDLGFSLDMVTSGSLDSSANDARTNQDTVDVRFNVAGTLAAGETIQASVDGGANWTTLALVGGKISLNGVNLTAGTLQGSDRITQVQLQVLDSSGAVVQGFTQSVVYDVSAPAGTIHFVQIGNGTPGSQSSSSAIADLKFNVSGVVTGEARVQWRLQGEASWTELGSLPSDGNFVLPSMNLASANQTYQFRLLDAAGNVGDAREWTMALQSPVSSYGYSLIGNPSVIHLYPAVPIIPSTAPGNYKGLISQAGLTLSSMMDGSPQPTTINYMDGSLFGVVANNSLNLDTVLEAGIYQLAWDANTFATASATAQAGSVTFAGGLKSTVGMEGFSVASDMVDITGNVNSADVTMLNTVYRGTVATRMSVYSGGGHDVILAGSGLLDIGYRVAQADSSDLIFGFNLAFDRISIGGALHIALKDTRPGGLVWASSNDLGAPAVVAATTEAVDINLGANVQLIDRLGATIDVALLQALNARLDLTTARSELNLLILARHSSASHGALLYFHDENDNQVIDDGELTFIATFIDGLPNMTDIVLVGTQT